MRGWAVALSGLALFAACHQTGSDPKRPNELIPPHLAPSAPAASIEYVPSEEQLRSSAHLAPETNGGDGGVIVGGLRVDARGAVAGDLTNPALIGGVRVPAFQGGGFLFWNGKALYAAKTFVAPLEPIFALPTTPARASFGNNVALLHFGSGGRIAFSMSTKKRVAIPVAGLIDTAALADGRGITLADPNLVLTLAAGSRAWKEQTQRAPNANELLVAEDTLWLKQSSGQFLRVEKDGSLLELSSVPEAVQKLGRPPERDPRWPKSISESPLQRAVRRGVPLDATTALVEAGGRFARIDLRNGQILQMGPSILTSGADCELIPVSGDVIAACRNSNQTSVVIAGAAGAQPEIEKVFARDGLFYAGIDGILAFPGPCSDQQITSRLVVCVRQGPGLWRELGEAQRADNTDPWLDAGVDGGAGKSALIVARWIPSRDGALGLVGGDKGGIFDASRGTFTPFTNEAYKTASGLFTAAGTVVDGMIVDTDGSIVGYTDRESLRVARDGSLTRSPYAFNRIAASGPNALGVDRDGLLWQSLDFGRSWIEVARPPGTQPNAHVNVQSCSRAGCDLGQWYRIAFRATRPAIEKKPEAAPAPAAPKAAIPRLVCEKTAPPDTRWATRARNASGATTEEFDLGAKKLAVKREGEIGVLTYSYGDNAEALIRAGTAFEQSLSEAGSPEATRGLGQTRTLRLIEPLGDAKFGESRFTWQDVLRAAITSGTESPSPPTFDQRPAVPVLSSKPGASEGLLLTDPSGVFMWARAGKPARVLSFGPENAGFTPLAAIVRDKDELVVLGENDECAARIISFGSGRGARTLSELPARPGKVRCPANPDTLAVLSDGSLAVLRVPSMDPPSQDDPALVLKPNQHPTTLAPWSTLSTPDACASDAGAVRALVLANTRWIGVEAPGIDAADGEWTLAVVRWSAARVCVEAAEVHGGTIAIGDQELPTSVLARFAPSASAIRRGFALGAEHSEALACKLTK